MTKSTIQEEVNPKNILVKIFTAPKEAFQFIESYKYNKHVTLLLILSGIIKALDKAESKSMGDHFSIWGVIGFSIFIGVLFGWILNYIYSFFISKTGRYLNGKASTESILRVLAYSLIPAIISLFVFFLRILIYGNSIFRSSIIYEGELNNIIYYFFIFIDLFLMSWSLILFIIGVSIVQKFSILKSIVNIISPAILIMIIAFILYITIDLIIN
ncbi:Yip1 domain protein [compost metagenome]